MIEKFQPGFYTIAEKDLISLGADVEVADYGLGRDFPVSNWYTLRVKRWTITKDYTPEYKRLIDRYGMKKADRIMDVLNGKEGDDA